MSFLSRVGADFHDEVKNRGRDYFRRGAARIDRATDAGISATVRGTHDYRVNVDWWYGPGGGVEYDCTCPYFQEHGDPCKHVWAALLQANADGSLPDSRAGRAAAGGGNEAPAGDDFDGPPETRREPRPAKRGTGGGAVAAAATADKGGPPLPAWKQQLELLRETMTSAAGAESANAPAAGAGGAMAAAPWPSHRRIVYIVDVPATLEGEGLAVELAHQSQKKDGQWDRPRQLKLSRQQLAALPDDADRQIIQMLVGARRGEPPPQPYTYGAGFSPAYFSGSPYGAPPFPPPAPGYEPEVPRKFVLPEAAYRTTLKPMCDTGRCLIRRRDDEEHPGALEWDDGAPWEFWLHIQRSPGGRNFVVDASLRRAAANAESADASAAQRIPLNEADLVLRGGFGGPAAGSNGLVFAAGRVARLEHFGAFDLLATLRDGLKLTVPGDQGDELLRTIFALPRLPRLDLPDELRVEESRPAPRPRLRVKAPAAHRNSSWGGSADDRLVAELSFDYDGTIVDASDDAHALFQPETRRVLRRDAAVEARAVGRLHDLGFRNDAQAQGQPPGGLRALRLATSKLPRVVRELTGEGWHVEAEGKLYRQPGKVNVQVRSGIDWFELHGTVDFGNGLSAPLPRLLAALRRGDKTVKLDDGTFGLLPEEWLNKYGVLATLGEDADDHLRFAKRQVGLLDALLASMPEPRVDEAFRRARDELMQFQGVKAEDAPPGFVGELRGYQREGLGWMTFLRRFGFGGCLADDMGLGKTVQVLALLESRRRARAATASLNASPGSNGDGAKHDATPAGGEQRSTSLVVVPKSLVFNWKQEAERFAPGLRVLDHTGIDRAKAGGHFFDYDLVLTTYGTLRRDAELFKDVNFDYAILDEAQAIKNAATGAAKAARLLRAEHRLALSGTPVQNHLGELWSLFEFLNPGLLGAASVFKATGAGSAAAVEPEAREVLSRALRPFVLRRTKEQVAKDLPEKLEQTIFCELEPAQRKQYDELRDHYRTALLERVSREGMNKAKIQILEALLRLRQAACHPGLIDKARTKDPSAKLDTLLEQIEQVLEEGHKALVFSQFTSLLSIVRDRLDAAKTPYEYLDGRTRDRQERVERFQTDPACKLFLISLKAGGLGLNLTAAEYVFLLDPWWNPAVESQAIDRAHRIGQTRRVFAYRLIAKDTVEEKVLALQQTKRDLADAIISADNSLIGRLGREELELLLS